MKPFFLCAWVTLLVCGSAFAGGGTGRSGYSGMLLGGILTGLGIGLIKQKRR